MDTSELDKLPNKDAVVPKATSHIIVELIEYEHNAVVSKSIMKRATGSINAMSFDTGEGMNEKTSPFDTYAQIIEGNAILVVNKVEHKLSAGDGIILPAHKPNYVKPNGRFKMLLTVIKSGYED
jgi:quercetin dioxygenase-like cupin family protein